MTAQPALAIEPARARPELEGRILEQCLAGNSVAMQAFVRHYQRMVFAFLARLLGPGAAVEDLAQEVFARALRALPRFDSNGRARLSTWLLTIASRLAIDEQRRARRASVNDSTVCDVDSAHESPEQTQHRRELAQAIARAVAALSHDQRESFVLAEIHGLTMDELASVTRVPVGTAKARLSRAREQLREILGPLWEELQ